MLHSFVLFQGCTPARLESLMYNWAQPVEGSLGQEPLPAEEKKPWAGKSWCCTPGRHDVLEDLAKKQKVHEQKHPEFRFATAAGSC
jgi:hypothetical protein